jgi:TonB family protein
LILEDRTVELGSGERHQLRAVGFSLIVHAIFMVILGYLMWGRQESDEAKAPSEPPPVVARVVIPTAEELQELLAPQRRQPPPPPPTAPPTPPPPKAKDRISIGPPSDRKAKQIWLKPDEEIANTARGNGAEGPGPQPATPAPTEEPRAPTADGGFTEPPRSILGSLQKFDKKLEQGGSGLGLGKVGPQHADIAYDPQGADFSEWIDHLRRELYRNWIAPQAAMMGFRGRVTVRFVVGRDGALVRGDIIQPSGTISLDRAAKNAVLGSRMRPLPPDYGPSEFELSVTFYYNEGPRPS